MYWNWIAASSAWSWSPYMNMIAGVQWRILEPLAISFQVRSLDPIPLTFTLHPEYSLGVSLVFGRSLPSPPGGSGNPVDHRWTGRPRPRRLLPPHLTSSRY